MSKIHHCILWGNQKPQLSGKRATVERKIEIWWYKVSVQCIQVTFDSKCLWSLWG